MSIPELGRLTVVPPRQVWPHEAHNFTPWLLQNVDVLSDLLGMDLELEVAEHPVGDFSLDLIGRDLSDDSVVIVENQLESSDHTHLGQILTYAAGTQPKTIVWVATRFRSEHRAALDWLNEHTDPDTRFFGVEIEVVKIGDSAPHPISFWQRNPTTGASKLRPPMQQRELARNHSTIGISGTGFSPHLVNASPRGPAAERRAATTSMISPPGLVESSSRLSSPMMGCACS